MRKDAVIDTLVGDEVMGLFIPLFIGEDAIRKMVEAGIELLEQTAAVGLEVGAGADFGVAYVGNVGEEEVKDFTALGDVVNTAARLQMQAQPAQLILSESVYAAVRVRFPTVEPVKLEQGKGRTGAGVRDRCRGKRARYGDRLTLSRRSPACDHKTRSECQPDSPRVVPLERPSMRRRALALPEKRIETDPLP
jgi:class 3 adenylate cyclase